MFFGIDFDGCEDDIRARNVEVIGNIHDRKGEK